MRLDFAEVLKQNQSMVYSIALRFLRSRETAEEVAQDVFLQFYQQMGRMEGEPHATAWLRRTVCHRAIDELRRRRLRMHVAMENAPEPRDGYTPPDLLLHRRLRELVDALPDSARMVVVLRYQEDLDPSDIASLLDMPISTVKSHLHRSLTLLRGRIEKQEVYS